MKDTIYARACDLETLCDCGCTEPLRLEWAHLASLDRRRTALITPFGLLAGNPSIWRSLRIPFSNSANAPRIVSMSLPIGPSYPCRPVLYSGNQHPSG